jgi:hypothetical protein
VNQKNPHHILIWTEIGVRHLKETPFSDAELREMRRKWFVSHFDILCSRDEFWILQDAAPLAVREYLNESLYEDGLLDDQKRCPLHFNGLHVARTFQPATVHFGESLDRMSTKIVAQQQTK